MCNWLLSPRSFLHPTMILSDYNLQVLCSRWLRLKFTAPRAFLEVVRNVRFRWKARLNPKQPLDPFYATPNTRHSQPTYEKFIHIGHSSSSFLPGVLFALLNFIVLPRKNCLDEDLLIKHFFSKISNFRDVTSKISFQFFPSSSNTCYSNLKGGEVWKWITFSGKNCEAKWSDSEIRFRLTL